MHMESRPSSSDALLPDGQAARRFVVCAVGLVVLLAVSKALAAYSGVKAATYILPILAVLVLAPRIGLAWAAPAVKALLVLSLSALLLNIVPDSTWDGNMYHKVAIVALHDGWNPWLFPEFSDWAATRSEIYYSSGVWDGNPNAMWVSHYPNLSWLFSAALMDYGFGWESGKALNLLLAIALFVYARTVFKQYLPNRWQVEVLALLAVACQPIVGQLPTNYVDGCTYSVIALTTLCILDRDRSPAVNVIVWCSLIILAGVKFTGALYAAMLALPFLVVRRPGLKEIATWSLLGAIALSHPYLNHIASDLDIGYPVTGTDMVLRGQAEASVLEKPRIRTLAESLLAHTSNATTFPGMKIPGTFAMDEIKSSGAPDPRFAGFGPLFSLALVIAAVAIVLALVLERRNRRQGINHWYLLAAVAYLVVMAIAHAAPWWARYVPFLYLALILVLLVCSGSTIKGVRVASSLASLVMLVNAVLVFAGVAQYTRDFALRPAMQANRAISAQYQQGEHVIVAAPQFFGFSTLYHTQHVLGIKDVEYQVSGMDNTACEGPQQIGDWIGFSKLCR